MAFNGMTPILSAEVSGCYTPMLPEVTVLMYNGVLWVQAERGGRGIAPAIHNLGDRKGRFDQHHAPAALPPGKSWYPLYKRLSGHRGWSKRHAKSRLPLGFDPWTVQPRKSRYTDYAKPAACSLGNKTILAHRSMLKHFIHSAVCLTTGP